VVLEFEMCSGPEREIEPVTGGVRTPGCTRGIADLAYERAASWKFEI